MNQKLFLLFFLKTGKQLISSPHPGGGGASLPEKEEFYSNLNMREITDADYMHPKRVCKDFEIRSFGEHHDLYLKSDALFLADVFENFRKTC